MGWRGRAAARPYKMGILGVMGGLGIWGDLGEFGELEGKCGNIVVNLWV